MLTVVEEGFPPKMVRGCGSSHSDVSFSLVVAVVQAGAEAELGGRMDRPWFRHRRSSRTVFQGFEETTSRGSFCCFREEDGEGEDGLVLALTRSVCVSGVEGFYVSVSEPLLAVSDVVAVLCG